MRCRYVVGSKREHLRSLNSTLFYFISYFMIYFYSLYILFKVIEGKQNMSQIMLGTTNVELYSALIRLIPNFRCIFTHM